MAVDKLYLGGFEFDDWSTPERMPLGGTQKVDVKNLPGGGRVVDVFGAVDHDPSWRGQFYGPTAQSDVLTLDQMRKSGLELPFAWGFESRTVVIVEFEAEAAYGGVFDYTIKLVYTDDSTTPDIGAVSFDVMVSADLATAVSLFF